MYMNKACNCKRDSTRSAIRWCLNAVHLHVLPVYEFLRFVLTGSGISLLLKPVVSFLCEKAARADFQDSVEVMIDLPPRVTYGDLLHLLRRYGCAGLREWPLPD